MLGTRDAFSEFPDDSNNNERTEQTSRHFFDIIALLFSRSLHAHKKHSKIDLNNVMKRKVLIVIIVPSFLSLCLKTTEARMPSSLNAINMAACADVCRDESVIATRNQFSLL